MSLNLNGTLLVDGDELNISDRDTVVVSLPSTLLPALNPSLLQSILKSDPRFKRMAEEHPEIRQALSDPNFLDDISSAMANPSLVSFPNSDARTHAQPG